MSKTNIKTKVSFATLIKYYFKPYPFYLLAIFIISLSFIFLETASTAVVYPMIDSFLSSSTSVEQNSIIVRLGEFVDKIPFFENSPLSFFALFLTLSIFTSIFDYGRTTLSDIFSRVITKDFQTRVYKKYLYSDYQYFLDNKQGTIIFRTITAPSYATVLYSSLIKMTVSFLKLTAIITFLFIISFKITLFMVVLGLGFYLLIGLISKKIVYRNSSKIQNVFEEQNVMVNEFINGIRQIKISQSEKDWFREFSKRTKSLCRLFIRNDLFRAIPKTGLQAFIMFCVLVVVIGYQKELSGKLTTYLPLFGVYFYAFMRLAPALSEITSLRMFLEERLPYAEAIYEELHTDSMDIENGSVELDTFEKGITFDKLSFTYPSREYTLQDINLTIEKGKTTALVGLSGSGKSTLIDLLIRLFDIDQGRIMVDGYDLKQLKLSSWLKKIGYVSQDTFIFNASIRDNIAFRADDVTVEMVEAAAKVANAHDFIMELPDQYDTIVGDRGMKLSGGQRQRLAIARAVLRNPQILIFDEATSSLDNLSEIQVQNAIKKISQHCTVILVAHRLSTVIHADKIVVFHDGKIVEQGNHSSLIAKDGAYSRLYKSSYEHNFLVDAEVNNNSTRDNNIV